MSDSRELAGCIVDNILYLVTSERDALKNSKVDTVAMKRARLQRVKLLAENIIHLGETARGRSFTREERMYLANVIGR